MSDNWSDAPSSSLPQPPSPPPPERRRGQIVVGAAVAALLAIGVALMVGLLNDDPGPVLVDGEATPPPPATDEPGPSDGGAGDETPTDTTTPESVPEEGADSPDGADSVEDTEAALAAVLPELIAFVESERGLEFQEDPVVLVLDDDAFVDRFNDLVDRELAESRADLEVFTGIYHALQILEDDVTLEEATLAFGEAGVIGFYDPETADLVIRGGDITPLVRNTIVHELVHALDDQWFGLDRPEYDDRDDEIGFGFQALAEGNARHIDHAYRDTFTDSEQATYDAEQLALGGDVDFSVLTIPFIDLQYAPYQYGELFAAELWDEGQATLDAAFDAPPDTSEQVMVTGSYRAGESRSEVAAPPADGEVAEQGVFGQLVLQTILATAVGDDAGDAAAGWSGDWFVVWNEGSDTCIRADVAMDDGDERDELASAVTSWVGDHGNASTELTADGLVRLTACG